MDQFGLMRRELGIPQIREFLEIENLTTDFSEIQYIDSLLSKMMFSRFLTRSVHLGEIEGHNSPENGVLQDFQQVLSLNIDDTELDLGRIVLARFLWNLVGRLFL